MYILLKPLFSRHKGIGVQFTDEPTGNLDPDSSAEVMDLFEMVHKRGMTVLVATHDISQVERLGHRRLELTMSPVNLSA